MYVECACTLRVGYFDFVTCLLVYIFVLGKKKKKKRRREHNDIDTGKPITLLGNRSKKQRCFKGQVACRTDSYKGDVGVRVCVCGVTETACACV